MRAPLPGILTPKQRQHIELVPPLAPTEQPTLMGAGVVITKGGPGFVALENQTDQHVAYVLLITPLWVPRVASFPWDKFFAEVAKPGGPQQLLDTLLKRLKQLPGDPE